MKIVFLTYHNWETKREGGFHKFAEIFADKGHETIFFSFSRPYFSFFKNSERLNKNVLLNLSKGVCYLTKKGNKVLNITWPTLDLPNPLSILFSDKTLFFLKTKSLTPFKKFHKKQLYNTDVYVFESAEGLLLYDKIKQLSPNAKFVYRPSDPMISNNVSEVLKQCEINILKKSNLNILVNSNALNLYKNICGFCEKKSIIISNGIDIDRFSCSYEKPSLLQNINFSVLYIGARLPNWDLIIETAESLKKLSFVVICPLLPIKNISKRIKNIDNLFYIPGIKPEKVPSWITNADLIMVPYLENEYLNVPRGITAKYYQAIIANKPIVVYHDTQELKKLGISVNYDKASFIGAIKKVFLDNTSINYNNISFNEWKDVKENFYLNVKALLDD